VAGNTRKPLLTGNAGKTHEPFRTRGAWTSIQAVMTRVTAHSARAREAWRAANGNLLLNVLIKLVDSGYVPIETVYLKDKKGINMSKRLQQRWKRTLWVSSSNFSTTLSSSY
jgi:hypothetical protein